MKNEGRQIIEVNPLYLMEHSVLENIPRLAPDQLESLRESIARRGLMEPLDVVPNPEHEGAYLIIDGRHRFEILRKANQPIPCIVHAEKDPLDFAIDKAVQGRQLTKSGVVLMLFENHPELAEHRDKRTGGRPSNKDETETAGNSRSFRSLAEKYRVDEGYFRELAAIRDASNEEAWAIVKHKIFVEEICIRRIPSATAGAELTKGKGRRDPNYARLAGSAITTVKNAFQEWDKIKWNPKDKRQTEQWAADRAVEMFKAIPETLYAANIKAIAETWKYHHKQDLLKALRSKKG
jgi:hypothetical protein